MGTTITEPGQSEKRKDSLPSSNGGGGWRSLIPANAHLPAVGEPSPAPAKTGVLIGLAAIAMSFAALTSALVIREASGNDWRHLQMPGILYLNTLILLASSVTLEMGKRAAAKDSGLVPGTAGQRKWLYLTLLLGIGFVAGQYVAWLSLRAQGLYLATNPNSSFFYLLTVLHALHVLGGLTGLTVVVRRLRDSILRRSTLDSFSYYWHFMGALWLYLLVIIATKL